ncbi:hypothetical protein [Amphritea japonica]|uniref:Guanylate cyclase domain-containing protein n=1 Tax=Amphritea japonica ATCC BAA-1530 TaxID=1278309 RepID=A0A7R6P7S2_9GAMM|nr:hypothetical protein [Amphritea japonica]BBB25012.1 conserved hypothetical protein [Amphritea japonica ATCC BAA-1530]
MDKPQPFIALTSQRSRLTFTLACILLGGLLLAGIYLSIVAGKAAKHQTREQGELLGQQTVTLIKPALLSDDGVSLNFVLNQLVRQPYVEAIILKDPKDRLIGRAGEITQDTLIKQEILIHQQTQTLAILELHLNPEPNQQHISNLLIQTVILALIIIILTLTGCWILLSRHPARLSEAEPTIAPTDSHNLSPNTFLAEATHDSAQKKHSPPPVDTKNIDTLNKDDPEQLVELLRPASDTPAMPDFAPFTEHKESTITQSSEPANAADTIVEEVNLTLPSRNKAPNPLFENSKHEVQLDLYTFEQELELIVAADTAGYLLYLDLASGHSDNIRNDELNELQEYYYRMLDMVIAIYQGEVSRIDSGDLQLAFLKPHKDDSHGINAICASQLFNRLYKQFNQQRIRSLKPVLNLHMALVRGHYKKLPRMQEEARFLTHSTESNDLITHTALSEAPDLKVSLLAGADIERIEEDKVLIKTVNENYQKLLDKQAKHLLKKLFP